jgi:hypothetical protein
MVEKRRDAALENGAAAEGLQLLGTPGSKPLPASPRRNDRRCRHETNAVAEWHA